MLVSRRFKKAVIQDGDVRMDAPEWLIAGSHQFFEWIGFGLVVGLAARAIMPGKDPNSAGATLVTGAGGAVLGCGTLALFMEQKVSPLSPLGFVAAVIGGLCLLAFFRLCAGRLKIIRDAPSVIIEKVAAPRRRRRSKASTQSTIISD